MFYVRSVFAALRRRGPRTAFERGTVALDRGDHSAALRELEAALGAVADAAQRATLHNKRGVALVALGDRAAALVAFDTALACDECCAPALANIGNLLFEGGHVHDAVDYYEAAIRADEGYDVAYRNLGVALKRLGRRAEAVSALRSAARLEARPRPRRV